ncbi:transposase, partial [Endothiovibrio diazotrophicus]
KTAVTRLLGISWRSVGRIVDRIVEQRLSPERLNGLRSIGIDEFSYRKNHRYITIIVDHVKRRVVWTAKGKNADSLSGFFET